MNVLAVRIHVLMPAPPTPMLVLRVMHIVRLVVVMYVLRVVMLADSHVVRNVVRLVRDSVLAVDLVMLGVLQPVHSH